MDESESDLLLSEADQQSIAYGTVSARLLGASIEIRCELATADLLWVIVYIGYLRAGAERSGIWPDRIVVHGVDTVVGADGTYETYVRADVYSNGAEVTGDLPD